MKQYVYYQICFCIIVLFNSNSLFGARSGFEWQEEQLKAKTAVENKLNEKYKEMQSRFQKAEAEKQKNDKATGLFLLEHEIELITNDPMFQRYNLSLKQFEGLKKAVSGSLNFAIWNEDAQVIESPWYKTEGTQSIQAFKKSIQKDLNQLSGALELEEKPEFTKEGMPVVEKPVSTPKKKVFWSKTEGTNSIQEFIQKDLSGALELEEKPEFTKGGMPVVEKPVSTPKKGFFSDLGKQLQRVWLETKLAWQDAFGSKGEAAQTAKDLAAVYRDIDLHTQALLSDIKSARLAGEFLKKATIAEEGFKDALQKYKKVKGNLSQVGAARDNVAKAIEGLFQVRATLLEEPSAIKKVQGYSVKESKEFVEKFQPLIDTLIELDQKDIGKFIDDLQFQNFINVKVEGEKFDTYIKSQLKGYASKKSAEKGTSEKDG